MDDETIKVAKKFLEEHPEEIKKLGLRVSKEIPIRMLLGAG